MNVFRNASTVVMDLCIRYIEAIYYTCDHNRAKEIGGWIKHTDRLLDESIVETMNAFIRSGDHIYDGECKRFVRRLEERYGDRTEIIECSEHGRPIRCVTKEHVRRIRKGERRHWEEVHKAWIASEPERERKRMRESEKRFAESGRWDISYNDHCEAGLRHPRSDKCPTPKTKPKPRALVCGCKDPSEYGIAELKRIAKRVGMKGYTKYNGKNKDELIALIDGKLGIRPPSEWDSIAIPLHDAITRLISAHRAKRLKVRMHGGCRGCVECLPTSETETAMDEVDHELNRLGCTILSEGMAALPEPNEDWIDYNHIPLSAYNNPLSNTISVRVGVREWLESSDASSMGIRLVALL